MCHKLVSYVGCHLALITLCLYPINGYCQLNGNLSCDTAAECGLGPSGTPEVAAMKAQTWLN